MALIDLLKLYIRIIILCLFKKSLTISRQAPFLHNLKIVNYINFATKVSNHKGLRIKFTIFLIRLYCKMNFMIPLHNVYFSPTTIKRILCSFPSISLTGRNNVHSPRTIILLICYGRLTSLLLFDINISNVPICICLVCPFSLQKNVIFSELSNPTTYSFSCSIIFHINIRNIMRKVG